MHFIALALAVLPLTVQSANVVLSNDDGWAEINIRTFYDALKAVGNSVIVSAPADNKSGTGATDIPPTPRYEPCEFNSCPADSPPVGFNASNKGFNYVNSYPATSMHYGIRTLDPQYWGENYGPSIDIALAGFNVGANLGYTVFVSGTVGAATNAVKIGTPGIAFSGTTGEQTAWDAPVQNYVTVYAELATNVTETLLASAKPYLPHGIWLNVNFPAVTDTSCTSAADFKFVLSRIFDAVHFVSGDDVPTCGSPRLPTETTVVNTPGCYASISVGDAVSKLDSGSGAQAAVLGKLKSILSCLPS